MTIVFDGFVILCNSLISIIKAGVAGKDQAMEMSPIADDFAAIARRMNEILEETRKADERAAQPPGRFDSPYDLVRSPRGGGEATRPRHH